jgi:LmbE family N-acetylglucosaminyl deacetylase
VEAAIVVRPDGNAMHGVLFDNVKRVLLLGAHADDIELGCGATVLKLTDEHPHLEITWVVLSAEGARRAEARKSAKAFLRNAGKAQIVVEDFRGSYFPYQGEAIKAFFETLKPVAPDLILTHHRDDRHQDHRVVSELTWNTFRSHLILEYEIPKYDGDLGIPNFFVPVTRRQLERKSRFLLRYFKSQATKHWFADELFRALPRIRGMECNSSTQFAEAYFARKIRLG